MVPDIYSSNAPCGINSPYDPFNPVSIFQKALEMHYNCNDEEDEALSRLLLRDLVGLTIGFEGLARRTNICSKSLHRMLSKSGNPTSRNMAKIICCLRNFLDVSIAVEVVEVKGENQE